MAVTQLPGKLAAVHAARHDHVPFPKGVSGNPSGRRKADQTITELARSYCPRAIEVLAAIMDDTKATSTARAMAAERILDRGLGKPFQTSSIAVTANKRAEDMTDDELAAIAAGVSLPVSPLPIEPELIEAEALDADLERLN
jgi:hypothetical protein